MRCHNSFLDLVGTFEIEYRGEGSCLSGSIAGCRLSGDLERLEKVKLVIADIDVLLKHKELLTPISGGDDSDAIWERLFS